MELARRPKILIIDSDSKCIKTLKALLNDKYETLETLDNAHVVASIQAQRPDLVLMNAIMPAVDGYEICRQIRKESDLQQTKVILIFPKPMLDERIRVFESGANDYVTKPFEPVELLAKVSACLHLRHVEQIEALKAKMMCLIREQDRMPMASILGASEILKDELVSKEERRKWVDSIAKNARQLQDVLQKGSLLCELISMNAYVSKDVHDLSVIMYRALQEQNEEAEEKHLRVKFEGDNGLWINANFEYLSIVCRSLLENAIRESPTGGEILISTSMCDEMVELSIADAGPGVPKERQAHAFTNFLVEEYGQPEIGDGLSLALCKVILDRHAGQISLESEPYVLTKFIISLPASAPEEIKTTELVRVL